MHVCVYANVYTGKLLCISASQKSNPFLMPFQCNFLFLLFFDGSVFFFFFFLEEKGLFQWSVE